jgi:hypothetical protein
MARSLLTLQAMRFSTSMKAAAIALSGLTAWGTSLARADEAPLTEPSGNFSDPAHAVRPLEPSVSVSRSAPAVPPPEHSVRVSNPTPAAPPASSWRSFAHAPRNAAPPPEVGIIAGQLAFGALATFTTSLLVVFVNDGAANEANFQSFSPSIVGIGVTPLVGGLLICGRGKTSHQYEGACAPTILGGYLGALVFAIPLGYFEGKTYNPDRGHDYWAGLTGALYGAAVGAIVGTTVGATIAWHLSKHRRERPDTLAFGPPLPPPAAFATWSNLQARPIAARAPAAVGVPLLSLRF